MASDLDRAYVVNGESLRAALAGTWGFRAAPHQPPVTGRLEYPGKAARIILEEAGARPLEEVQPVTEQQLAAALTGFGLMVHDREGRHYWGVPLQPEEVARKLHGVLGARKADPDTAAASDGTPVTAAQLAAWFRVHELATTGHAGDSHGKASYPEALAEVILGDLTGQVHQVPPRTPNGLVSVAENGVTVTRGDLWAALQRIPPAGEFATHTGAAPYARALLLSILASRECESCSRSDAGGGCPCDCPVACGARYCQHSRDAGPAAPDDGVVDAYIHEEWCNGGCGDRCAVPPSGAAADPAGPAIDREDAAIAAVKRTLNGLGHEAGTRILAYLSGWHADRLPW